jgi:hypothetical protein
MLTQAILRSGWDLIGHGSEDCSGGGDKMKKSYKRPELEVFGTVTELTLNACNVAGSDGKTCRNLEDIGRTTPGSDNAGFPKG